MSIRRTPKYPPSQTRISVQDTYDAGTPQGTAQINEEFRRIQLGVNAIADKVEAIDPKVATIEQAITPPVGGRGGDSPLYQYITNTYGSGIKPEKGDKGDSGWSGKDGKDGFVADYFGIEVQTDLTDLNTNFPDYKTNKINFVNPSGNLPITFVETPIHFSGNLVDDTPLWQLNTGANDTRYRADINAVAYVDLSGVTDTINTWISGYNWSGLLSGFIQSGIYISGLDAGGIEVQINSGDIPGHVSDYKINKINFIDPTTTPAEYLVAPVVFSGEIVDDSTLWQAATGGDDTRYSSEMKGYAYVDASGVGDVVINNIENYDYSTIINNYVSGNDIAAKSEDKGWIWYFTGNESDVSGYCYLDCNRPDDLPNTPPVERFSEVSGAWIYTDPDGNIAVNKPYTGWITPQDLPVAQLNHIGNWAANVILSHRPSDATVTLYKRNLSGTETEITNFLCDYIDATTYHYHEYHIEKKENCVHWEYKDRLVAKITPIVDDFCIGGVDRNYFGREGQDDYGLGNASGYEPSHIRMPIPEAWYGGGGGNLGITTLGFNDIPVIQAGEAYKVDTLQWIDRAMPASPYQQTITAYNKWDLTGKIEPIWAQSEPSYRTMIESWGDIMVEDIRQVTLDTEIFIQNGSGIPAELTHTSISGTKEDYWTSSINFKNPEDVPYVGLDLDVRFNGELIEDPNFYNELQGRPYQRYRADMSAVAILPATAITDIISGYNASGSIEEVDPYFFAWDKAAEDIVVTASGFDGNLTSGCTNVQLLAQAVDDLSYADKGLVNIETLTNNRTMLVTDKYYNYFSSNSTRNVVLPTTGFAEGKKFYICNYNAITSAVSLQIYINAARITEMGAGSYVVCIFTGSTWIFENLENKSFSNITIGKDARSQNSSICIGNDVVGNNDSVCIGNNTLGSNGSVAIGDTVLAGAGSIALGNNIQNTSAQKSIQIGYRPNNNGKNYSITLGADTKSYRYGEFAITGDGAFPNMNIRSQVSWNGKTSNNTPTELFLFGVASERCVLLAKSMVTFQIYVSAINSLTVAQGAAYRIEGAIRRDDSNNTVFVGVPTIFIIGEDNPDWNAKVEADNTNDALVVKVTGVAATSIDWHAAGYLTEVRI